jgi:putative ABC transport system substrate-binding protein
VLGQQFQRLHNIAVLMGLAETDPEILRRVAIFREALRELGWTEGQNVRIHYRSGIEADRMHVLATELIALQPDIIVAGSSIAVSALLRETRTIPIVFVMASDPIGDGFVASLAHPDGNATGFTGNPSSVGGKWLELLRERPRSRISLPYSILTQPLPPEAISCHRYEQQQRQCRSD